MRILSIDTSTEIGSIALLDGDSLIAEVSVSRPMNQLTWLAPAIKQCMDDVSWQMNELEGVAVGCGPGSFTGLRVGIATAKSIAQVYSLPIAGISSLDAIAYQCLSFNGTICAVMKTRCIKRKETNEPLQHEKGGGLFTAFYKSDGLRMVRTGDFIVESPLELADRINLRRHPIGIIGDAGISRKQLIKELKVQFWWLPSFLGYPRGANVGYLAYISGELNEKKDSLGKIKAIYLRSQEYKTMPLN